MLDDQELYISVNDHFYCYSEDIRYIEEQEPNPDYLDLYKQWEDQFDSRKYALRGMIT